MLKSRYLLAIAAIVLFSQLSMTSGEGDKVDIKEEAEKWFTKQATGLLGKKFLEKVKCKKFFDYMDKQHPGFMDSNENKLNVMSTCESQRKIERDRRDLQDYAVKYFNDAEEAELSTCKEFAEDFLSEYSTFSGEKGEAEAYCYFFKEEGNLAALRQVQQDHKAKTKHMDAAINEAKRIHEEHVVGADKDEM
mmetsp:Transcript_10716/g.25574  ORF Transcript_10716/g.25574 Transcript_10716/m.25574 type:complete len:192 (-) Transcript_10716:45-620(-)